MEEEIWKDIYGCEGYYQVSSFGRVRSLPRVVERNGLPFKVKGRILSLRGKDYKMVSLYSKGKVVNESVHRLVAFAFLPPPTMDKTQIDHINTIKTDNRVANLRWVTRLENANNPITMNNREKGYLKRTYSEADKKKFLENLRLGRELQGKKVLQLSISGTIVSIHKSIKEASLHAGVCRATMGINIAKGDYCKKGYIWRMLET